jgi:hypothetical protein
MEIPVPLETAIHDGRAVLFLGAGASMEAVDGYGKHPPNSQQLSELLAARFLGGRYKHLPLSQVAEYAINETDLRTVQDFIKDTFEPFQPSVAHLLVPQFMWWGLATTNYDRLVEQAYERTPDASQVPRPFIVNGDRVEDLMRDPRYIMYLKLHGCITKTSDPRCPLILTADQYVTHRDGRSRIFDHFKNWCYELPIVFVGYGIQDSDMRAILMEFATSLDTRPRYYAVMRDVDDIQVRYWETKKITLLQGTFEEFMRTLDAKIPRGFRRLAVLKRALPLPVAENFQTNTTLSEQATQFLSGDVEYVKAITGTRQVEPKEFYRGATPDWAAIEQNLDVRRGLADTILSDHFLVDEMQHAGKPEVILIRGHAGAGISILIRRIAWDAARDYDCLCLFLKRHGVLNYSSLKEVVAACSKRIYLFVDDAAERVRELRSLIENIGAEGSRLTLVLAERINEWNMSCGELGPYVSADFELRYLTSREIDGLLVLLEQHRALGTLQGADIEQRRVAFADRAGRQLLVALHEATLGRSFEDIIEDEYRNIRPLEAQRLYLSICVLNRLNVPVRAGIIARMHGIPFESFKERLFAPLERVVQTEFDPIIRDYVYQARHPQIAEIVFQRILRDQEYRFDQYIMCLRELNVDYSTDRYAFRQMVRGRTVFELFPNHELARRIYETARLRVGEDAHLLHQMGVYEMNRPNGNLREAAELLLRAAALAPWDGAIKHSTAEHRLKVADIARTPLEKEKYLREAAAIASTLKSGEGSHSFGHHTLVKVGLRRLEDALADSAVSKESIALLVRDIERNLSDGLQKLPGNAYLLDAEAQFARLMNDSQRMAEALREAFAANPRNAFIALRLSTYHRTRDEASTAKEILERALDAHPGERRLHFAYAQLLREDLNAPGDQILYHLQRSFTPGDQNLEAQMLYGRQLFINGDVPAATAVFRALEKVTAAPELRAALLYPLKERFHGNVVRVEATYCFIERDGFGEWIFAHRNDVGEPLWGQLKTTLRLSFQLGFSLRGPRAFDIRIEQGGPAQPRLL